jgi:hypothetical protein
MPWFANRPITFAVVLIDTNSGDEGRRTDTKFVGSFRQGCVQPHCASGDGRDRSQPFYSLGRSLFENESAKALHDNCLRSLQKRDNIMLRSSECKHPRNQGEAAALSRLIDEE